MSKSKKKNPQEEVKQPVDAPDAAANENSDQDYPGKENTVDENQSE